MKTYYKMTDENMRTYGDCQWELGVKKVTNGKGELCGPGFLHCYTNPLLAGFLNPIHANFKNPRLFEVAVGGDERHDYGIKCGFSEMMLAKEIAVPAITTEQRVKFALLCAASVYKDTNFVKWSKNWTNGLDRSAEAAEAARSAARSAAWAAAWAAEAAARSAGIDLIAIAEKAIK
jgi:hypothetical protein